MEWLKLRATKDINILKVRIRLKITEKLIAGYLRLLVRDIQ